MEGRERGEKGEKDGRTMGGRDLELKEDALTNSITKLHYYYCYIMQLLQYCIVIDLVFKLMIAELDKMTAV